MEIEKKYLVKKLPENLETYPFNQLEQCYLCVDPVVRIRRRDDAYILTYKSRLGLDQNQDNLCVAHEFEGPLTREAYESLKEKREGEPVTKTRYKIPYGKYTIELDVFEGRQKGVILAEVEFETVEEANSFVPPVWFGEDVSGDYHYRNNYMATQKD